MFLHYLVNHFLVGLMLSLLSSWFPLLIRPHYMQLIVLARVDLDSGRLFEALRI